MKRILYMALLVSSLISCGKKSDMAAIQYPIQIAPVLESSAVTKAVSMSNDNLNEFVVDCYFTSTGEKYFTDTATKGLDGKWHMTGEHWWPIGMDLDFVCRTNTDRMINYTYDDLSGVGSFQYAAPTVADQADILIGTRIDCNPGNCPDGHVVVSMEHALSAVFFKTVDTFPQQVIFNSICIKDIKSEGTCRFMAHPSGVDIKWSPDDDTEVDYLNDFNKNRIIDGLSGVDGFIAGVDFMSGEYIDDDQKLLPHTFILIPTQRLSIFDLKMYTGSTSTKEFESHFLLNPGSSYTFVLDMELNEVTVAGTSIENWKEAVGISHNM